jgi:hypothetical protein
MKSKSFIERLTRDDLIFLWEVGIELPGELAAHPRFGPDGQPHLPPVTLGCVRILTRDGRLHDVPADRINEACTIDPSSYILSPRNKFWRITRAEVLDPKEMRQRAERLKQQGKMPPLSAVLRVLERNLGPRC